MNRQAMIGPAVVLMAVMLIFVSTVQVSSQSSTAVKNGDPLDLYIRKSGIPRTASLKLYPAFYPEQENTTEFLQVIESRGSDTDHVEMYMPRAEDENDNSFKYRPNGSVSGRYSFHIACTLPTDIEVTTYTLRVRIEMDYDRGSEFKADDEYSFDIQGPADGQVHRVSGNLDMNTGDFESFSGQNGGRIKVSLIREDFSDSRLTLYLGYLNKTSDFRLPFSRFSEEPIKEDENDWTVFIIIGVVAVLVIVGYIVYDQYKKSTEKKSEEEPERPSPRRKSSRRGGR